MAASGGRFGLHDFIECKIINGLSIRPTLAAACAALPPGGAFPLGAALRRNETPTLATPFQLKGPCTMKITDVKTFVVGNPPPGFGGRYFVFIKLITDNGIEGFGKAY